MVSENQIRALAIKKLKTKEVQDIKKKLCHIFKDKKQQKECKTGFDKGFIQSFTATYKQNHM